MFCVAQKMVYDKDVVSDIVQEVFVYYYQKLESGHEILNLKNWLLRATINKSIDQLNRRKKYVKLDAVYHSEEDGTGNDGNDKKLLVDMALSALKPKERGLAVLYSEGFSYKEISQMTGISYTSVGKTLSRTLEKLKGNLIKLNYEMYS